MKQTKLPKPPLYLLLSVLEEFREGSVPRTRFEAMMEAIDPSEVRLLAFYYVAAGNLRKHSSLCLCQSTKLNGHRCVEVRRLPLLFQFLIGIIFLGMAIAFDHPKGVYVREFVSGLCVVPYRLLGMVSLIRDVRGLAAEESVCKGRTRHGSLKFGLLRWLDRLVMLNATILVCVSQAMRRHLGKEYGIQENRCHVIPNFASWDPLPFELAVQLRAAARQKLGLSQRLVVAYSGSTSSWQCIPETLRLFKAIKTMESRAFLLLLTRDLNGMTNLVQDANLSPGDYRVERVSHSEMRSILCAADWAVALRDRSTVNLVSSPTKVVEYFGSGLPLILTDSVGDFSSLVETLELGVVIPYDVASSSDGIEQVARQILSNRLTSPNAACLKIASGFSKKCVMNAWRTIFSEL